MTKVIQASDSSKWSLSASGSSFGAPWTTVLWQVIQALAHREQQYSGLRSAHVCIRTTVKHACVSQPHMRRKENSETRSISNFAPLYSPMRTKQIQMTKVRPNQFLLKSNFAPLYFSSMKTKVQLNRFRWLWVPCQGSEQNPPEQNRPEVSEHILVSCACTCWLQERTLKCWRKGAWIGQLLCTGCISTKNRRMHTEWYRVSLESLGARMLCKSHHGAPAGKLPEWCMHNAFLAKFDPALLCTHSYNTIGGIATKLHNTMSCMRILQMQ